MRASCSAILLALLLAADPVAADDDLAEIEQRCLDAWQSKQYFRVGFHCNAGVNRGGPISQYVTGLVKRKQDLDSRSNREAHRLLMLSAAQGYAPANTAIGRLYQAGQGVDQDWCEAEGHFRKAADAGELPAQRLLGESLFVGLCSGEQDMAAALPYLQKCANFDARTRILLGMAVALTGQDLVESRGWLRSAELEGQADERAVTVLRNMERLMSAEDVERSDARVQEIAADIEANPVDCASP